MKFYFGVILVDLLVNNLAILARENYYNMCTNFRGMNADYRNCLYAAPRKRVGASRDIILSGELRKNVDNWCRVTVPWQRDCFRRVTAHCDHAEGLVRLAETSGLCNGTKPDPWVNEIIRHFPGLDRTCLQFIPLIRPGLAEDAVDIRMFQKLQKENFESHVIDLWFSVMKSACYNKEALFYYKLIYDLMRSDLGSTYETGDIM